MKYHCHEYGYKHCSEYENARDSGRISRISNAEKEFKEAFWNLYAQAPIEKISVSRLCQVAGYNRATFYNHFKDIYDLQYHAVEDIFLSVRNRLLADNDFREVLTGNLLKNVFMTYFEEEHEHIEILFKRRSYYLLGDRIKKELLSIISEDFEKEASDLKAIEILIEYQISAVLGVVNYWCQQGKSISEQDILKTIYEISSKGFLNSLRFQLGEALV